ncbi:hypothetical protein ACFQ4Z_13765 [Oceanobacillus oncorhynchi subsp. oncorhynchi]|uniref:hypothetical protein n=1 Tax=Oceanobacillus TaxID=182709 RepID=UPI0030D87430
MPAESDFPERTSLWQEHRYFKDQAVFLVFLTSQLVSNRPISNFRASDDSPFFQNKNLSSSPSRLLFFFLGNSYAL